MGKKVEKSMVFIGDKKFNTIKDAFKEAKKGDVIIVSSLPNGDTSLKKLKGIKCPKTPTG
jgi:hypothetical protein